MPKFKEVKESTQESTKKKRSVADDIQTVVSKENKKDTKKIIKKSIDSKNLNSKIKKKDLVIVESPAKARTIKTFLGSAYEVIASVGHVRDLPKKKLGVQISENSVIPTYEVSQEHKEVVKKIKDLHKNSNKTYIATDEDREGEAIGYHIAVLLEKNIEAFPRIVFHEITKNAILNSLENPRTIDMNKVNAQQARRILDRLVGFKLSNLIAFKISRGLSAGRVQSSTLKILADRELEIKIFNPQDYYLINASFENEIIFELTEFKKQKIEKLTLTDKNEVDKMIKILKKDSYFISSIKETERNVKSPPPFITSTLQQTSSTNLGYSPSKTMMIAQKLYEGVNTHVGLVGVITYMRTDSLNISKEALNQVRNYIKTNLGDKYLSLSPKIYLSKQSAQEAHEAIRPTNLEFTPEIAKNYLNSEEFKVYSLIFNRFVASQCSDAKYLSTNVTASAKNIEAKFKISGRIMIFDGFYKVLGISDKDKLIPSFKEGQDIEFNEINEVKKTTEPPPRFSEASLIKKMEELGIGRPSTYAPTVRLLVDREYINIEKKQIIVNEIALNVIKILENHFNEIVDSGFSASLESKLDEISSNNLNWQDVIGDFYSNFSKQLELGKKNIPSQKVVKSTGQSCPICGNELIIRSGKYGEFITCSNYPACKYKHSDNETSEEKCEKCGSDMIIKNGRNGKFLACSAYPKCKNTKSIKLSNEEAIKCPKCEDGNLILRFSKKGRFYGCSNYPKCNFISKEKPIQQEESIK